MIIYDKNLKEGLAEFGIEIPIHHSRAARTFEKLKGHNILGPMIDRWLISSISETITRKAERIAAQRRRAGSGSVPPDSGDGRKEPVTHPGRAASKEWMRDES